MKTLFTIGLLLAFLSINADASMIKINGQFAGNDDEASVEAELTAYFATPVDLTLYDKSDSGPVLTAITQDAANKNGTWDVLASNIVISFVTVKGSNSYSIYRFDPAQNSGDWTTAGLTNNGGRQPAMSHLSFWTVPQSNDPGGVPEPLTMGLFGSGLASLLVLRKFRR